MHRSIPFNRPPVTGKELEYIQEAIGYGKLSGDGEFTRRCSQWMRGHLGAGHVLLTTSCTHALEMAAFLCDLKPGDEVIMPSYTFVSTADAFVLQGARIVFVDIEPKTMNIDPDRIEEAITEKTKVIVPVHYAGVGCDMDRICSIAARHGLKVVEDAAQGVNARYKGRALGTIGDFGCYSFHETKNYSMGEGGALVFGDDQYLDRAEILREKGTDRSKYFRGQIDKYSWVGYGSSYLPSELNAAYLYAGLEAADEIDRKRHQIWDYYDERLRPLAQRGLIEQPCIPEDRQHNAHMYYIKLRDQEQMMRFIAHMKGCGIYCAYHYVPLHSAKAGLKYGRFAGEDRYTTRESSRLVRLPMFYNLDMDDAAYIAESALAFEEFA